MKGQFTRGAKLMPRDVLAVVHRAARTRDGCKVALTAIERGIADSFSCELALTTIARDVADGFSRSVTENSRDGQARVWFVEVGRL